MPQFLCEPAHLLLIIGVLVTVIIILAAGGGLGSLLKPALKRLGGGSDVNITLVEPNPPPSPTSTPPLPGKTCSECLRSLAEVVFPCKEHSGLVTGIQNTLDSINRIEGTVGKVWGTIDGLRDDIKELIKNSVRKEN